MKGDPKVNTQYHACKTTDVCPWKKNILKYFNSRKKRINAITTDNSHAKKKKKPDKSYHIN